MQDVIFLPFPRQLYEDVVRFSDGRLDLVDLAVDQFHDFIRRTADDNAHGVMGERLEEFLVIYHPDIIARWRNEELDTRGTDNKKNAPLIWKEVIVPAGSEVRMQYGGGYHLARVESGKIMDKDGHFSPSE